MTSWANIPTKAVLTIASPFFQANRLFKVLPRKINIKIKRETSFPSAKVWPSEIKIPKFLQLKTRSLPPSTSMSYPVFWSRSLALLRFPEAVGIGTPPCTLHGLFHTKGPNRFLVQPELRFYKKGYAPVKSTRVSPTLATLGRLMMLKIKKKLWDIKFFEHLGKVYVCHSLNSLYWGWSFHL